MPPGIYELQLYSEGPDATAVKNEDAILGHIRIELAGEKSEYDVGTVELVAKSTE